jgi:class 3 adenylate cyclase
MEKVLAIGSATTRRAALASTAEVVAFPAASERTSRTFVCTVLFLDIAEYSRKPVAEQLLIKERFNHHVSQAIADIALPDRIILDTGDGVAVNFLGDPEDALVVALRLTHSFAREGAENPIQVRAGINLGPVRLARDINGQPNIIGDGINVAQRVMSFAQPAQVLVSRSYHEVITRISDEYERLFAYQGSRTDKHVREHEIYELEAVTPALRQMVEKRRSARRRREVGERSTHAFGILSHRGLALGVLAGSTLAFVAALLLMLNTQSAVAPAAPPAPPAPRVAQAAPAPTPIVPPAAPIATVPSVAPPSAASAAPAAPSAMRSTAGEKAVARPTTAAAVPGKDATKAAATPAEVRPEPVAKPQEATPQPSLAEPTPAKPAAPTALVALAISPWGEVYVNGKHMGVSPPLTELELPRGRYRIEVRNGSFKPFEEDYELGSNETVRIKHKFMQQR